MISRHRSACRCRWKIARLPCLCPCDTPAPAFYGLSGLSKVWPGANPMCAKPTGHRPGIDQFIGNQIAMRTDPLGPGWKCLEIRRKLLANPSQVNYDWGISLPIKDRVISELYQLQPYVFFAMIRRREEYKVAVKSWYMGKVLQPSLSESRIVFFWFFIQ